MKKSLIALIASALIISSVSAGDYEKKYVEPGYKTAIIDESLNFEAEREGHKVMLEWDAYDKDDFKYYKVMRSETHSNPVYPDQPAIKYFPNADQESYAFWNWSTKSAIYRVCVITTDKSRICSQTVKLEWYVHEKKEYNSDYEKKKEYMKEKYEKTEHKKVYSKEKLQSVKKPKLDSKLAGRADKMVDNLVARLEKKHGSDTAKKAERLETIIKKLETLNEKISAEQTRALITYIIEGLKEALNEMWASDDIEEIFNILEEE